MKFPNLFSQPVLLAICRVGEEFPLFEKPAKPQIAEGRKGVRMGAELACEATLDAHFFEALPGCGSIRERWSTFCSARIDTEWGSKSGRDPKRLESILGHGNPEIEFAVNLTFLAFRWRLCSLWRRKRRGRNRLRDRWNMLLGIARGRFGMLQDCAV